MSEDPSTPPPGPPAGGDATPSSTTPAPGQTQAPGWYPGQGGWWWWDGSSWGQFQPVGGQVVSGPPSTSMAVFAHLGNVLLGILVPIVLYFAIDKRETFNRWHIVEALNFGITVTVGSFVMVFGGIVLAVLTVGFGLFVIIPAFMVVYVLVLVFGIQASIAANRGEYYRYPVCLRLISE